MTIKTVETESQGLKRAFMLTIPAKDIDARVDQEVRRIAPQVRMHGFRPGKVPPNLIRKMHGDALQRDALSSAVQEGVQKLIEDKNLRPAMQPEVELKDEYQPGKDAEVHVRLESLPEFPLPDIEGLKLERLTVAPDEKAVDEQIDRLLKTNKGWKAAPKSHKAAAGDLVVMDFEGKVGGEPFEGGKGEDMPVELGSGRLIPGFEDQLAGAKAGDKREVKVTFPSDYPVDDLKGKDAVFDVTVKEIKVETEAKADDEFAKSLGLTSMAQLREILRSQQEQELNALTRTHMKRRLLDQLSERAKFDVPESMVEAEFQNIMNQLRHEAGREPDPKAAMAEIESEAGDYRKIAERRVRLGLLLSEIGAANGIEISEQEMSQLIVQAASQYEGKDRERFIQYIQQEPAAAAQLRAPLYEDKVVDFLFSKADITDREASRKQLEADLESEEGHVHGPGCGHELGDEEPKAEKAARAKGATAKPAASKAAKTKQEKPAKASSEKPAKGAADKGSAKAKPAKPLKGGAGGTPAKTKKTSAGGAKAPVKVEEKKPAQIKAEAKKPTAKKFEAKKSATKTSAKK